MTRKKTAPKLDADQKSLTREQRELKKSNPRTRSTSPNTTQCLHNRSSQHKPKRKPKPRPLPPLTPDQIAAQVSARIAQLSQPLAKPTPSVKVNNHAELQSSKIARLTSKIAVTEVEIQRLRCEQLKAREAVQQSLEVQRSAALAILERREALEKAIEEKGDAGDAGGNGGGGEYKHIESLKEDLENNLQHAKQVLSTTNHPEDILQIPGHDSPFTNGVARTGESVMERVMKLFEKMESDGKRGTVSEGARIVLDALARKPSEEAGRDSDNGLILEVLARALRAEEGRVAN
ncbi:hypothetical protein EG327_010887 [Venturia inaequalis]|uniref:Uncharacterized protein n=1 Tax=Venturia inaequalis TaxID=5025 RepID=A0A8H3YTP5_VENIN|nr:hypothetical protein EG327_010887 [Venturia inaequalis]